MLPKGGLQRGEAMMPVIPNGGGGGQSPTTGQVPTGGPRAALDADQTVEQQQGVPPGADAEASPTAE